MNDSIDQDLPEPPECRQLNDQTDDSVLLDHLLKQPLTNDEAGGILPPEGGSSDNIYRRLSAPCVSGSQTKVSKSAWHDVYYVYGDERRAIRKAIRRNTGIIADIFTTTNEGNPFDGAWSEEQFNILCEEWEYYRRRARDERDRDNLPEDFFQNISDKKEALIQILLNADGEWVSGDDIRSRMQQEYDLTVTETPRAISIHLSQFSKLYSDAFRQNLIPDRWVYHPFLPQREPAYRIGEKYEAELREWFN